MPQHVIFWVAGLTGLMALVFLSFPEIDLWVAGWFFLEPGRFVLTDTTTAWWLGEAVDFIVLAVLLGLLFSLTRCWRSGHQSFGMNRRRILYLLLVMLLGPGLMVNTVLKDNWGRARPLHVSEFGGDAQFTPPVLVAAQCERNCSFVSGDASVGFYFVALAFVFRRKWLRLMLFGGAAGLFLGFERMLQGAHFLSDVLFSGVVTFAVAWLLAQVFLPEDRVAWWPSVPGRRASPT